MTTITPASTTLFLRQVTNDVQYSTTSGLNWNTISVWPVTLNRNAILPASLYLTVEFTTDLTLTATTQYFIMGTDKITVDGSYNVVNVNVDSYPGLIKNINGSAGYSNITVQNVGVISTYTLANQAGWIGQASFGKNASNCSAINCYSTGAIGDIGTTGGGIFGFQCSSCSAINCYSTGAIGDIGGGIFGFECYNSSAINCYSTGTIGISAGGIFGSISSNSTATNCYSTGTIGISAGGIFGSISSNSTATNCYYTNGSSNWSDTAADASLNVSDVWTSIGTNIPYLLSAFTTTLYNPSSDTNASSSGVGQLDGYTYSLVSVNTASPSSYPTISIGSSTGTISFGSLTAASYVVNVLATSNTTGGYFFGTFTDVVTISNICFPAKTPITCNQGIIHIDKIDPAIHTIRNMKIVAITKSVTPDSYLVQFEKDALGKNMPCERTTMSKNHCIMYNGKMIPAKIFTKTHCQNVKKVPYSGEVLYNVLLEQYDKMVVNNLICETVHPNNFIAQLYKILPTLTPSQQIDAIKEFNAGFMKEYTEKKVLRNKKYSKK